MVLFKSLIVIDVETTSLPHLDHNTTRITELSLIGCEVEQLRISEGLPRVLHKLVLIFNPWKLIRPEASAVSGLTNEIVVNAKPLSKEDVDMVKHFISRLPSPVCIVAHNGDNFDFPILRRAFEKLQGQMLQNNVYCADSIKAFRHLLPKEDCMLWTRRSKVYHSCEVTPEKQGTQPFSSLKHKKVSKVLFPSDDDPYCGSSLDIFGPVHSQLPSDKLTSYKLRDIYYYYFGKYFEGAHRAEEDSKALLCCIKKCEGFLDWINENAVIFNSIQPLF